MDYKGRYPHQFALRMTYEQREKMFRMAKDKDRSAQQFMRYLLEEEWKKGKYGDKA